MALQISFDIYESATQLFIDQVMEGLGIKPKKEEKKEEESMDVDNSGF